VAGTALERLIDFRDRGNEHRFFDLASMRCSGTDRPGDQLYADLGDDLSDEARGRMEDWWTRSSASRSVAGSYPPEAFGLDADTIADQFAFYNERFGVPVAPGRTPESGRDILVAGPPYRSTTVLTRRKCRTGSGVAEPCSNRSSGLHITDW